MEEGGQAVRGRTGKCFIEGAVWGLWFDLFFAAIYGVLNVAIWASDIPAVGKLISFIVAGGAAWAVGMFWVWLREEMNKRRPVPGLFQVGIIITFSPLLVGLAALIIHELRG